MSKIDLKYKAVELRKQGKTYSEILSIVPVAKSTLSEWLHDIGLSSIQKQRITKKKRLSMLKGSQSRHIERVKRQINLISNAKTEILGISKRELWLIGITLYWAEGTKEKEARPGSGVSFSNSDPKMIALFIRWLTDCVEVSINDISADLYIHESHMDKIDDIFERWATILKLPLTFFKHVYFKKNKIQTKRKNTGALYIGLLRVNISASSDLNRKIAGWIEGICTNCGVV